ncbi:NAD-dependent succinate-semialdehyde dehydrogenase [Rappaport israeli]|uniref:NAD-dependent succinate-semialdehyde dehydrogenase n=1 Tax=Rappaport israeli TaxID=1839807 RepID=UPI00092FDB57|nr:NAD-dependent succinate-semialdehyde dehydrogenase [Rappaport israeli]
MNLQHPNLLRQQAYLNGQWVSAKSQQTLAVTNPATGETLAHVPNLSAEEAQQAVHEAHQAQHHWAKLSAQTRCDHLLNWYNLILKHKDDLAQILSAEQGKPLKESQSEIEYGANYIRFYAEQAKRIYGETLPAANSDQRILVIKQPIGVAAAITPWNFPNAMIARKVAPALAAGCSFIVRPASQTPLSALALAYLSEQAQFPKGLFNVLTGESQPLGEVLTQHPLIRKFSFTGSTSVGQKLYAQASKNITKVSLELGGNAPFIVFADADLDSAIEGAIAAKYRNSGQTCVCANRFYVHSSIYDAFIERLTKASEKLRLGNAFTGSPDLGPLIDSKAVEHANALLKDALTKGASLTTGGKIDPELGGTYFQATVLKDANHNMDLAHEELFAPIAAIYPFDEEEEVIRYANDTPYGLSAYFYSRDIGRITRVYEQLQYGIVGVNTGLISNPEAPFGGVKQSGIGREGSHHGIEDYLELKYILLAGINA